jgi:hypothetical protein
MTPIRLTASRIARPWMVESDYQDAGVVARRVCPDAQPAIGRQQESAVGRRTCQPLPGPSLHEEAPRLGRC